MNEQPPPIKAIESAWKDMVAVLFTPFDFVKWLILGIPLFLINCGSGGGSNFGGNFSGPGGGPGGGPGQDAMAEAVQWVDQRIGLIGVIIAVVVLLVLLIAVVVSYLQSRGIFMLINMLSTGVTNLGSAWSSSTRLAHSFFLYQLVLMLVWMVFPLIYLLLILGWPFLRAVLLGEYGWSEILGALSVLFLYFVIVGLPLFLLNIVVRNFAIPIMAATDQKVIPATKAAFGLFSANFGWSIVYLVFLFVFGIGSAIVVGLVGCLLVCMIVGCIPILGGYVAAVVTAPVGIFMWAYTLRFVEHLDGRYAVLPDALDLPPPPSASFGGMEPSSGGSPPSWPPAPMPPPMPPDDELPPENPRH